MGTFSIWHLLVVAVIILIFFGPSKIEGLGKALGRSIRGFKEGLNEIDSDAREVSQNQDRRQELTARQASAADLDSAGSMSQSGDKQNTPDKRNS
jgi:sec-independent protein translocase protein TatA